MSGEKPFKPDDDEELTRGPGDDPGAKEKTDEEIIGELRRLRKSPVETPAEIETRRSPPLDAEPFDAERAKTAIVTALGASVRQYGAHFALESDPADMEGTRLYGTDEINDRIQKITVAKEWIKAGRAAEVIADEELSHLVTHELKPDAVRALKKLGGQK